MNQYDVILIRSQIVSLYNAVFPPFGAIFLGSRLKKEGYKVKIFDAQVEKLENLYQLLKESEPIWIGFTDVMTGPAIKSNLEIAQKVRQIKPGIPLVWGGPHPSVMPEQTAQHELVDIVGIGEGERTVLELTEALKTKKDITKIAGLAFIKEGRVIITPPRELIMDWDKEVSLDWDLVDFEKYINRVDNFRNVPIITSRGCPFRCGFCYNLKANRRRYRGWSLAQTIEELKKLIIRGVNYITFEDDNFLVDKERTREIAKFLHQRQIKWGADNGFRVDSLDEKTLQIFKETGCDHLSFGAESGSQRILDLVQKDTTVEQILKATQLITKYNIAAKYSWMIGFPGESKKDIYCTLDLIDQIVKINPNTAHYIGLFSPYPGIPLAEKSLEAGWQIPKSLPKWALFREEQKPIYIKNIWFLRAVMSSCFLNFALETKSRTFSSGIKYKFFIKIFRKIAKFRWKHRFFSLPLDFILLSSAKKILETSRNLKYKLALYG